MCDVIVPNRYDVETPTLEPLDFSPHVRKPLWTASYAPQSKPLSPSEFSKPELDAPKIVKARGGYANTYLVLSNFLETVASIEKMYGASIKRMLNDSQSTYAECYTKNLNEVADIQKQDSSSTWWDYILKIATCIIAAASMVVGATLVTGALASTAVMSGAVLSKLLSGGAMFLGGFSTIAGNLLKDTHSHDKLATGLMLVGAGLGVAGSGIAAWSGIASLSDAGRFFTAALAVATNTSSVVRESHRMKASQLKVSNITTRAKLDLHSNHCESLETDFREFSKMVDRTIAKAVDIAEGHQASIRQITSHSGKQDRN